MIAVGLTGSIGMGKSTAAAMIRAMGIPVFCADEAVHAALAPGGAGVAPVTASFSDVQSPDGGIDRKKLRAALGQDHAQWDRLEAILHPLARAAQQQFRSAHRDAPVIVLDIPLLFETGGDAQCDYTICVTAPAFIQRRRVLRRGTTESDFRFRLSRQMPDAEKRKRASFVVQTGWGMTYTRRKLSAIIRKVCGAS